MKTVHRFALPILSLFAVGLVSLSLAGVHELGMRRAAADVPALAVGSGSAAAGSAAPVALPAGPVIHDPVTDPGDFISDLKSAKRTGWPLLLLIAAFGLCEILAAAGSKIAALAWLGRGRVSIVVGGATAVIFAAIAAVTGSGSWSAVLGAAVTAGLLYAHPAGTDPAKA